MLITLHADWTETAVRISLRVAAHLSVIPVRTNGILFSESVVHSACTDKHPWPSQTIQKMDMAQPRWETPQPD